MRAFLLGTVLVLVQGLALADNPVRLVIHGGAGTIDCGTDLLGIAGDVTDDGIDLAEGDFHAGIVGKV